MAHAVVMPRLGNSVESCILVKWNIEEGKEVKADTALCVIETDKATMDVPAGFEGVLLRRMRAEGDDIPVLETIALIGEKGEAIDAASPRARSLARERGMPLGSVEAGTGPRGRILERDVRAALEKGPALTAGARAGTERSLPASGTGLGGRITTADLSSGGKDAVQIEEVQASGGTLPPFPGPFADTPLRGIRKIISSRMVHSLQNSAQITLHASAPAARLLVLRERLRNSPPSLGLSGITIGDIVAAAAVRVVRGHPKLNAHVLEDSWREFGHVHLGMAVDTPRGLVVPVLRYADSLSLKEFSRQAKALARACIDGAISPDQLSGATFTVTNLGMFGIESFTPVLNEPETAILGVDAIVPRPVVRADGSIGAEQRIGLSLTVDHRIVDGADAARYLKDLSALIADIDVAILAWEE